MIFPALIPVDPKQSNRVRRGILFGSALVPGRNKVEYLYFSIEKTTRTCDPKPIFMGLLPV